MRLDLKQTFEGFRSIGIITVSMVIGAILGLTALPWLSRLYTTKDFGIYGLAIAIISVFSTVASLRLDQAILVAEKNDRLSLMAFGAIICVVVTIIAVPIVVCYKGVFFAGAIGVGIVSNGLMQLNYSILFSEHKEIACGALNVSRTGLLVFSQLTIPYFYKQSSMLHGLYLQCIILICISALLFANRLHGKKIKWKVVGNYKDFIFANTPHAIFNSFSHNIPYYFVSHYLGVESVGYYTLVDRILKAPIALFSQVVRQFFIRSFSPRIDDIAAIKKALISSILLFWISAPFFIGICFLPTSFYQIFFGPAWGESGIYFSVMTVGYWAIFTNPPVSAYIIAARRSDFLLKLQLCDLIIKILLAILIAMIFGKSVWILASVSTALVFYNASCFVWVLKRRKDLCDS